MCVRKGKSLSPRVSMEALRKRECVWVCVREWVVCMFYVCVYLCVWVCLLRPCMGSGPNPLKTHFLLLRALPDRAAYPLNNTHRHRHKHRLILTHITTWLMLIYDMGHRASDYIAELWWPSCWPAGCFLPGCRLVAFLQKVWILGHLSRCQRKVRKLSLPYISIVFEYTFWYIMVLFGLKHIVPWLTVQTLNII